MKFNSPSKKSVSDTATLGIGAVLGGAVSRGVFGAMHEPKAVTPEDKKKERNYGYAKRAAIIAIAGYAASAVTGTESGAQFAKGSFIGMAVMQAAELVKDVASNSTSAIAMRADESAKGKFVARTLGLGCPCDVDKSTFALNAYHNRRRLNAPLMTIADYPAQESINPLEQTFNNAALSA